MRAWTWWLALALAAARARELDPAACAARFDVQRDKIIRTEESREMGARYLAELDVGSRAECLRLCCETDACDVFVYEEKSTGSCYLFKCGPPEDFRCKFTAHGNFSSGVLALSRHLAELQDQERLAHHERELAGLRNSAATSVAPPASPTPQPLQLQPQQGQQQQHHQPLQAAPPPPREPPPPPPPPRRCSRYQFECRRGGECIAVYNACDGVPQCADGSDEAPELGCPAPPTAPAATTATTAHAAPTAPTAPRAHPDPVPAAPRAQVVQVMEGGAGAPAALWPHRLAQAQRRYPVLTSGGGGGDGAGAAGGAGSAPHIFSHQGGLLQPAPLAGAWPRRSWPPDQRNEVDNVDGGVGGAGGAAGWGYSVGRLEPWGEERRAWPVPPRLDPELPVYVAAKTMPELPLYPEQQQQQALRDAPKKGFELETGVGAGPAPAGPAAPPSPSVESTTKKKALKDMAAGSGPGGAAAPPAGPERAAVVSAAHEARAPWGDESDGLSEHPPAAVLLLVLGNRGRSLVSHTHTNIHNHNRALQYFL